MRASTTRWTIDCGFPKLRLVASLQRFRQEKKERPILVGRLIRAACAFALVSESLLSRSGTDGGRFRGNLFARRPSKAGPPLACRMGGREECSLPHGARDTRLAGGLSAGLRPGRRVGPAAGG